MKGFIRKLAALLTSFVMLVGFMPAGVNSETTYRVSMSPNGGTGGFFSKESTDGIAESKEAQVISSSIMTKKEKSVFISARQCLHNGKNWKA